MTDTLIRETLRGARRASTRAVRAGICTDQHHGAVVPPLHLSSTFAFEGFGKKRFYDYTRSGNPTRDHLAAALTELECGAGSVVTSSGMSAVLLAIQLLLRGSHDFSGSKRQATLFSASLTLPA